MSAAGDDDMPAVGQMPRHFFAPLRWRDWIHQARKDQDRNIGTHGLMVIVRYFSSRPHAARPCLLFYSVIAKRVPRIRRGSFILINERHIFRAGDGVVEGGVRLLVEIGRDEHRAGVKGTEITRAAASMLHSAHRFVVAAYDAS